jgi:DNA-binding transcriptional regulator YdaS (Cro superfamily)
MSSENTERKRIETLHAFIPRGQRAAFAESVGVTPRYLTRVILGYERASAELAIRIERASHGNVDRADVRPDLFKRTVRSKSAAA